MPEILARKISAASGEIFGEQREVTVLVVSLTNSPGVRSGLDDDEELYFLKDEALRLLAEVVYKYEGTIDKFTGDGLMALFGAPVAHENDPERAVRAALEMQTIMRPWRSHLQQEDGLDFHLRLGLNTGPVIAGTVGNDLHMDYTVVGETVSLASHLEMTAEPGTILVSTETYQRARPFFEFKARPFTVVEWLPDPIQTYHVLNLRNTTKRGSNSADLHTHMIGRASDLDQLKNALHMVGQQSHSRVALVTGEAGLGKSRLVAEFCRGLSPSETSVYQGSCLNYARPTPLWVVAAVLRDMVQLSETGPSQAQQESLRAYLDRLGLVCAEILPYLLHVLGLEQPDPRFEARLQQLDAVMLQRQTHAALRQVLLAEANRGPTVLIFEDLHWVDQASADFLAYLIRTTTTVPLLLVLVSRQTERETILQPLLAAAQQEAERLIDIQLQPLSESESHSLADQLIQQTGPEAWTIKQHIVKRAEGNPFYVEQIFRMLIDQGGLERDHRDGSWQVTAQAIELLKVVPGTVKGLILARCDRLPEGVRRTLQLATILGISFPVSLLQALNDVAPETVNAHLDELEARHLLSPKPFRSTPGYIFRQALTQETIYGTLIKRDRRKIHSRVARAIEHSSLWLPEEQAEVLAYHYAESSHPAQAVPYLITAADNAARRCAYQTAIEQYRRAMSLLPDSADDSSDEFFRIRIGLGRALKFVGEFAEAERTLSENLEQLWSAGRSAESKTRRYFLVECLRQLADIQQRAGAYGQALVYLEDGLEVLGEAEALEQSAQWRGLVDRLAWIHFRQGQLEQAFDLATLATTDQDPAGRADPRRLASLYNTLGGISWQQGQLAEAISYVEQSLQLHEGMGYLWGIAIAYGNLGILYFSLGNWSQAANYYEQAYAVQQVIGNLEGQAVSSDNLGVLHTAMGQHQAARPELEAALSIRQRLGDAWGKAQSQLNLARLALIQSNRNEAEALATVALERASAIGSVEIEVEARSIMAMIRAENDEPRLALQLARQALELAQAARLAEKEAECLRVAGKLSAQTGQYEQAETLLRNSLALAIKQNDPYQQGLTLLALGQVYQHLIGLDPSEPEKWRAEACDSLNKAVEKFEALGAAHDLNLAQAALNQIQNPT
jgi:class 3 adenylate cyclase/tetratricopeptide (TPR) repeat protein